MAQDGAREKSIQILYADDEDDLRAVVERVLSRDPTFHVTGVGSGEAVLDLLARQESKPDLILLDIVMPGLGGLETARRIRVVDRDIPIIFFTANGELAEEWQASDGPILGTLNKPFDFHMLAGQICRMLEGSHPEAA